MPVCAGKDFAECRALNFNTLSAILCAGKVFWLALSSHEEIIFPTDLARDSDSATVFLAYPLEALASMSKRNVRDLS